MCTPIIEGMSIERSMVVALCSNGAVAVQIVRWIPDSDDNTRNATIDAIVQITETKRHLQYSLIMNPDERPATAHANIGT